MTCIAEQKNNIVSYLSARPQALNKIQFIVTQAYKTLRNGRVNVGQNRTYSKKSLIACSNLRVLLFVSHISIGRFLSEIQITSENLLNMNMIICFESVRC